MPYEFALGQVSNPGDALDPNEKLYICGRDHNDLIRYSIMGSMREGR